MVEVPKLDLEVMGRKLAQPIAIEIRPGGIRHFTNPEFPPYSQEECDYYAVLVRALRHQARRTQLALAEEVGLRVPTISRIEMGRWPPTKRVANAICGPLAVTPQSLYPSHMENAVPTHQLHIRLPETAFDAMDKAIQKKLADSYSEVVLIALAKLFNRPDFLDSGFCEPPRLPRLTHKEIRKAITEYRKVAVKLARVLPRHPSPSNFWLRGRYKTRGYRMSKENREKRYGERRKRALQLAREHPEWTMLRLVREIGVARATAYKWTEVVQAVRANRKRRREAREKQKRAKAKQKKKQANRHAKKPSPKNAVDVGR